MTKLKSSGENVQQQNAYAFKFDLSDIVTLRGLEEEETERLERQLKNDVALRKPNDSADATAVEKQSGVVMIREEFEEHATHGIAPTEKG